MAMNEPLFISAIRYPAHAKAAATAWRDFYMLHKLVYAAFPTKQAAEAARPLFRFDVEGEHGYLYVQTTREPDWTRLPAATCPHVVGPRPYEIPQGERLRFRLLARPSARSEPKARDPKRKRKSISSPQRQLEWLRRKGEENGFRIERCEIVERIWHDTKTNERLPNGSPKPLYAVQFDGVLVVTDRDKLREAVRNGIGPQKAYGFGLLSLAPLEE
jgi:CRISPR system Cascade subunit CasE